MQSCLVCDDHGMMREALAGVVRFSWPMAAISTAEDFPSAWREMAAAPTLCLCDLSMPGAQPLDGVQRLQRIAPETAILVVTGSEDDTLLLSLLRSGIAGFVPKTSRSAAIEAAIRVVLAGERYLPSRLIELASASVTSGKAAVPFVSESVRLTERQIEVLQMIARGRSNKEIARALQLSPATVKAHLAAAFGALGVANRTEAVIRARELRLV